MFSAGEIAKSIHAVAQCIQTIRAGNNSSNGEEDSKPAAAGMLGSSALSSAGAMSSILSQQHPSSAPSVSVVSSSMDFFGAPESSASLLNDAAFSLANDLDRSAASNSSRKTPATKSGESEKIPASSPNSKKIRLERSSLPTSTTPGTLDARPSSSFAANSGPSFEQAAIVAALENLYGKAGVKKNAGGGLGFTPTVAARNSVDAVAQSLLKETSSPHASLPPKKLQHISRALLGTSNHSSRGGDVRSQFLQGLRPTAEELPDRKSPGLILPKKAPYLDSKPSAVKQSVPKKSSQDSAFVYNDTKFYNSKSPMILQPSAYDVLLGRGKSNKNHPGNKRFQDCIQANRERYFNALTNVAKRDITMEILQFIRQKGRFLRRSAHGWVDVPTSDIQQKVAHALQYRRRCVIKEKGVPRAGPSPGTPPPSFKKAVSGASLPPPGGMGVPNTLDPKFLSMAMSSGIANHLQAARNNDYDLANAESALAKHNQQIRDIEYYQSHLGQLLRSSGGKSMEKKEAEDEDHQVEDYVKQLQQQQFTTSAVQQYLLQNARPSNSIQHRVPPPPLDMSGILTNRNPASSMDTATLPRELQQVNPPSSDNLDSSGLHSLADVISRIYNQDQMDSTLARGCHGA